MTEWQEHAARLLAEGAPMDAHWEAFQAFARDPAGTPPITWRPDGPTRSAANLSWLMAQAGVEDYAALHRWSVEHRADFWRLSLERLGVRYATQPASILGAGGTAEDPVWLPGARLNVAASCFQAGKDRPAIIAGGEGQANRIITYGELKAQADQVSHGLVAAGLDPGDAVALYMPMNVECVAAYLGIVQAGMVVVSIPDSFAAAEVATRLRLGAARMLVTVDHYRRGGRAVAMHPKALEAADAVPGVRLVTIAQGAVEMREGDLLWRDLLQDAGPFEPVAGDPQDTTNILFSSGTTGEPKAIPWTQLTPLKAAVDGHWHQDIHADDVVAWPTNIGWMMGPWLIYATFLNQATMALFEGVPTSPAFVTFLQEAKVSVLGVVPAIVRAWRESAALAPGDLPSVRIFSSTGEASNVRDYLYLTSLASYRAPVIEYCGGTEIGGGHLTGTVLQPASPATFTTPALGLDFVLLADDGTPVEQGMGELYLVPPSIGLSQRLINRDHHKEYYAGCPKGPGGVTLRRHGDEVQALPGGFWAAQGRADDTMNLGGIKVGSIELERAMNEHPDVSETAAVGIPPAGGGADRLVVFAVVQGSPDKAALRTALQGLIKTQLNPLFRVHDIVFVPALPRTASNKVMRRQLRTQYVENPEATA